MKKQKRKTIEQLEKISKETIAKVKKEKPATITPTTLMNMLGVEVIDHTKK